MLLSQTSPVCVSDPLAVFWLNMSHGTLSLFISVAAISQKTAPATNYVPDTQQKLSHVLRRLLMHQTFLCQLAVTEIHIYRSSLNLWIQFSCNFQSLRIELFTLRPRSGRASFLCSVS